jgi:hypothetical protein
MSATLLSELTVSQARRRLNDTSRMASEEIDALQKVVDRFHNSRPRNQPCAACGSMVWSEHATDGNAIWACDGCHRPASLTREEWHAQRQAAAAVRAVQDAATAAAVPEPHGALKAALAARQEAATALERLEQAVPAARTALASAQVKHDAAVAAMAAAERAAVTRLAASMTGTRPEAVPITQGAARGGLRSAEDSLSAARGARALLDDQLHYAQRNVADADAAVRSAALRVLGKEELENLLETAVSARAHYIESISGLSWLIRNGAVPVGDARPHQLVLGADSAPARWPEAAHADGGMAERLAALMEGDHP